MVLCPKCGKNNPPYYTHCYWCNEDITEITAIYLEHMDDPINSLRMEKEIPKFVKIKTANLGGAGYLFFILALVAVSLTGLAGGVSQVMLIFMLLAIVMFVRTWYHLSGELEDEHMKLFGVFSLGFALLNVFFLLSVSRIFIGVDFGYIDMFVGGWGSASYLVISVVLVWVIRYMFEYSKTALIIVLLLALNNVALIGTFLDNTFSLVFLGSFVGLFVFYAMLHARNLHVAGKKFENGILRFAGQIMVVSALLLIFAVGLLLPGNGFGRTMDGLLLGSVAVSRVTLTGDVTSLAIIFQLFWQFLAFVLVASGFFQMKEQVKSTQDTKKLVEKLKAPVLRKELNRRHETTFMTVIIFAFIIIGLFGANLYVKRNYGWATLEVGNPTASITGFVSDKNNGAEDNFKNGKVTIRITILVDDIDDVLNQEYPMETWLIGTNSAWRTEKISMKNARILEDSFEDNITLDGVLEIAGMGDNLYFKITVPVSTGGDVVAGSTMVIELWPTTDPASAIDDVFSPATFDNESTDDFWEDRDVIGVAISSVKELVVLTGSHGAVLVGQEIDIL